MKECNSMENKLLSENKKLMFEWNYEKNGNLKPEYFTVGSSKKVWWKCNKGHEWEAVIHTRIKGVGCPYCMGKKAIKGLNDFATLHPEMLKEWDYEKNEKLGIIPNEVLVGSQKKVNWICNKGHRYSRSVYDRLNGRGNCPYCGNRKVLQGYNDLVTTNPELLKEWDYEENGKIGIVPNEITNGGKEKVWWRCEKGHKWSSIIRSRITGSGCPYCSNNLVKKGYNDIATTNPELLNEWNYEKNERLGITPFELSHGSTKKVWWKCEYGHEYEISVAQKTNRNVNCPICANQQVLKGYNDFATKHPTLLKEWNYEKNKKLGIKPDEIILGGKIKFWWKCEKGHEWQSSISARIRNDKLYNRCPICSSYLRTSIPEKIIFYYMQRIFPKTQANYKPKWLKPKELDIYIPELNTGIEYDGYYYHKDIKQDIEKDNLCKENNVKLIRIREKNAPSIMTNAIIYTMQRENTTDYTYIEEALSFLKEYLKLNLNYNIKRDFDEIMKMITFIEKENCIAKTNPEILQEWNYEKNNEIGIKPENMSNGSSLKIWWKCEKGHDYQAVISTKINQATKCPYCANKKILVGFNDLATTSPELIVEWDYEKNNKLGIKPQNVVRNSTQMVNWKCKNGHEWMATLNNRARGSNCPYCSGRYAIEGINDFATLYPHLLKEWDYEENNKLGIYPENVKKKTGKKVWWRCESGHLYQTTIANRTKAKGTCCPYCLGKKVLKGFNDITTTNPELLKEWDYSKNFIKPEDITEGTHKKIWWICKENHSYEASVPSRRKGTGCPYCSGNKVLQGYNDLATTNPELLKKWDYEKNDKLGITPKTISKSYSKKVWWRCKNGHEYERYVYNQRNGYGKCPICKC